MPQKIKNQTKYILETRKNISDDDRKIVRLFIDTFMNQSISPFEIRLTSKQIKAFLLMHKPDMSFTTFNRITVCFGRTSENQYSYSVPVLLSIAEPGPRRKSKYSRTFPTRRIKTISFYGSKRRWLDEYQIILKTAFYSLDCTHIADCFGGSGFISLLASRMGLFDCITLNEGSTSIFNYHSVMKSDTHFQEFADTLSALPLLNAESFYLIRNNFYDKKVVKEKPDVKSFEGREIRKQLQNLDVQRAVHLYVIKHFAFQCQGGFATTRVPVSSHVEALKETHKLYKDIALTNHYYRKPLIKHLYDNKAFIILDPPYLQALRVQKQSYELEFTERQHRSLLQLLSKEAYPAKILLCGYKEQEKDMYSRYLRRAPMTWHCMKFKRPSGNMDGLEAKEFIWVNFGIEPLSKEFPQFFDYIF